VLTRLSDRLCCLFKHAAPVCHSLDPCRCFKKLNEKARTMLISVLTNTFAMVEQNATEEIMYQKAIKTIERVKGDALVEYLVCYHHQSSFGLLGLAVKTLYGQPPTNLLALLIMFPASKFLSPRWFHKVRWLRIDIRSQHLLTYSNLLSFWPRSTYFASVSKNRQQRDRALVDVVM
jgi:hypothetical protein